MNLNRTTTPPPSTPISSLSSARLLSTAEVADYLDVELRFVRKALLCGALRGLRLGKRKWRVRADDLQQYVADAIEAEQRKVNKRLEEN